ncbi:LysM peptidoglycan-binding domain-containing protein [Ornithinimicrobium sp. LYQ92]|uniref:LysM peptidoglycan-binding domain-containing protein n=1 Tax=Serinicoccus sp. LYQ92 TaxID=3378798 RepID=UPI003854B47E
MSTSPHAGRAPSGRARSGRTPAAPRGETDPALHPRAVLLGTVATAVAGVGAAALVTALSATWPGDGPVDPAAALTSVCLLLASLLVGGFGAVLLAATLDLARGPHHPPPGPGPAPERLRARAVRCTSTLLVVVAAALVPATAATAVTTPTAITPPTATGSAVTPQGVTPSADDADLPVPGWTPTPPPPVVTPPDPGTVALVAAAPRAAPESSDPVVVHRGDTLWSIAARHLGADATTTDVATEWPRWYAANRDLIGDDPDLIRPGQELVVPADDGRHR